MTEKFKLKDDSLRFSGSRHLDLKYLTGHTNHLESAFRVKSDITLPVSTTLEGPAGYSLPYVASITDYDPFGPSIGAFFFKTCAYRFGFNGKENDNEVKGSGGQQDYGMRIYDTRLGRFLSVDPLSKEYPWNSTYAFAENTPIWGVDLDGLELQISNKGQFESGPVDIKKINATNWEKDPAAVTKYLSAAISQPEPPKPMFKLQFKTEAGAVVGAKVRVIGQGAGVKIGASKPLTTAIFTENGPETKLGGNWEVKASGNMGILSGNANINTQGEASMTGSAFILSGTISTEEDQRTEIQIFELAAAFGIGGDISLTIDGAAFSKPLILSEPNNDGSMCQDETTVAPPYIPK